MHNYIRQKTDTKTKFQSLSSIMNPIFPPYPELQLNWIELTIDLQKRDLHFVCNIIFAKPIGISPLYCILACDYFIARGIVLKCIVCCQSSITHFSLKCFCFKHHPFNKVFFGENLIRCSVVSRRINLNVQNLYQKFRTKKNWNQNFKRISARKSFISVDFELGLHEKNSNNNKTEKKVISFHMCIWLKLHYIQSQSNLFIIYSFFLHSAHGFCDVVGIAFCHH